MFMMGHCLGRVGNSVREDSLPAPPCLRLPFPSGLLSPPIHTGTHVSLTGERDRAVQGPPSQAPFPAGP